MHKLGVPGPDGWDNDGVEHVHPAIFEIHGTSPRVYAGVPYGNPLIFETLTLGLTPPYMLLYVLHTPRGEAEPGRYQSPYLSEDAFRAFMRRFGSYLGASGRFDIWARSEAEQATVVWDRHNFLFAYGPITKFEAGLKSLGFSEGKVPKLGDHVHHYRPECDEDAKALLAELDWYCTPLKPQDEQ